MNTIVSIFTIISAVATAIYTVITIRTLREIKKQRETTYMPNVILGECSYRMITNSETFNNVIFEDTKTRVKQKNCHLNIYNIGLASAQDLRFQFKINNQKFINLLTKNKEDLTIEGSEESFLFINSNKRKSGHNIPAQLFKEKDFLLPVNIEKSSYQLELPLYLTEILAIITYDIKDNFDLLSKLPNFKLEIKYKDLYNKEHIKEYSLTFNIFSMTETDVIFEILKL